MVGGVQLEERSKGGVANEDAVQTVVIVGAGLAGLATALALHRYATSVKLFLEFLHYMSMPLQKLNFEPELQCWENIGCMNIVEFRVVGRFSKV